MNTFDPPWNTTLSTTSGPISWVVGRGGLLGHAIETTLSKTCRVWRPLYRVDWRNHSVAQAQLTAACKSYSEMVGDSPWQVLWCAGPSTLDASTSTLARESELLSHLLLTLTDTLLPRRCPSGSLFLASSAGGIYSGSSDPPPFTEASVESPTSAYGWNKLEQETVARQFGLDVGASVLIGRISTLYGPGQNPAKRQGLINQICMRALLRQPLILYAPLDTLRDYLFVTDAAARVCEGLRRLRHSTELTTQPQYVVKNFASQRPVTVATLLADVKNVLKRPVLVIPVDPPHGTHHACDLRGRVSDLDRP